VKNSFGILLLDYSLEYCRPTHSVKLALLKAIVSLRLTKLQQSTHKAKCTQWAFLQSVFHLYVHAL